MGGNLTAPEVGAAPHPKREVLLHLCYASDVA